MLSDKDRRRFKRYRLKSGFHLSIGGNSFQANTIDYSLGGIGLSIEDTPPITSGSAINLHVEDLNLNIDGKIVWSEQVNSNLRVGIERASISGFLKHYLLPDIFLDLHRSEKNGILDIRNGSIIKRIYIKNGDMVFATSNKEEDRLGEVMLKAGRLTIDQYYQSVDIMKKTGKRQGAALVELGYLKPEDVIWIVRHQVEEIILSLFQWEDGNFIFKEGPLPSDEAITLKLSAANLIYRGIKRINSLTHNESPCGRDRRVSKNSNSIFHTRNEFMSFPLVGNPSFILKRDSGLRRELSRTTSQNDIRRPCSKTTGNYQVKKAYYKAAYE